MRSAKLVQDSGFGAACLLKAAVVLRLYGAAVKAGSLEVQYEEAQDEEARSCFLLSA